MPEFLKVPEFLQAFPDTPIVPETGRMARLPATIPSKLLSLEADKVIRSFLTPALLPKERNPVAIQEMIRQDRISRLCIAARRLTALMAIGQYVHPDESIQDEVRSGIAGMQGSWQDILSRILNYDIYGHGFTEKQYSVRGGFCVPVALRTLDPRKFYYEGSIGAIERVKYRGFSLIADIPYSHGIHLVNEPDLSFDDPYGYSIAETALNFWELEQLVWGCIAIAAQRQATPILALKTDAAAYTLLLDSQGVPVVDRDGNQVQIPLRVAALESLEQVGNSGAMVIDRLDELIAVNQQSDGKFFELLIYQLRQARLESFLVPVTVAGTSQTGIGDSNLGSEHRELFNDMMRAKARSVCDALVEQWIKPWLQYNHGRMDDYGHFPISEPENPQAIALADTITNAVARGAFLPGDDAVLVRLEELLKMKGIARFSGQYPGGLDG